MLDKLIKEAWPKEKPKVEKDGHSWFSEGNKKILRDFLNKDTKLVMEVGSW